MFFGEKMPQDICVRLIQDQRNYLADSELPKVIFPKICPVCGTLIQSDEYKIPICDHHSIFIDGFPCKFKIMAIQKAFMFLMYTFAFINAFLVLQAGLKWFNLLFFSIFLYPMINYNIIRKKGNKIEKEFNVYFRILENGMEFSFNNPIWLEQFQKLNPTLTIPFIFGPITPPKDYYRSLLAYSFFLILFVILFFLNYDYISIYW